MNLTPMQELAVNENGTNILVSAAAGSGKTRVLTERVIRALLENRTSLDKLLIVTFTVSAAAEMKGRIAEALQNTIKNASDNDTKERLSQELLKLGSAQISTIDAFFQSIVKENFVKAGVPADFRIGTANEVAPIKERVLQEVLNEFYKKYANKTKSFAGGVFDPLEDNDFAKAMDNILPDRNDGKLLDTISKFENIFHREPKGVLLLKESADLLEKEKDLDFLQTTLGKEFALEIKNWANEYKNYLLSIRDCFSDSSYRNADTDLLAIQNYLTDCDKIIEAIDNLWDYDAVMDLLVNSFAIKPSNNNANDPIYAKEFKSARDKYLFAKIKINGSDVKRPFWKKFALYSSLEEKEGRKVICESAKIFADFLSVFEGKYLEEKMRLGILEFDDIKQSVGKMLLNDDQKMAETIGSRYDEILIDEYQDVDPMQDAIFASLQTAANHRFMVGDIKQSIYGFRGSEPSLFSSYRDNYAKASNPDGKLIFMSDNFRCDKPIIDFANMICAPLFKKCKTFEYKDEDDLVFKKGSDENHGKVQIDFYQNIQENRKDLPFEMESVCKRIQEMISSKEREAKDITILCRKTKQVNKFYATLKKFGVPCKAVEDNIDNRELFYAFYTYLKVLENPREDMTLVSFLLSKVTNITEPDVALLKETNSYGTLYDALLEISKDEISISKNSVATVYNQELIDIAKNIKKDMALSLSLSCEKLIAKLLEVNPWKDFAEAESLLYFYETARSFAKDKYCSLADFLEEIDIALDGNEVTTSIFGQEENAVSIMTIHKSKGLQFPVVFLPCLDKGISDHPESFDYFKKYGFVSSVYNSDNASTKKSLSMEVANYLNGKTENEEEIRLLYVAMTRAQEELYLSATLSKDKYFVKNSNPPIPINNDYALKSFTSLTLDAKSMLPFVTSNLDFDLGSIPYVYFHYYNRDEDAIDYDKYAKKSDETSEVVDDNKYLPEFDWGEIEAEDRGVALPVKVAASQMPDKMLDKLLDANENDDKKKANDILRKLGDKHSDFDSLFDKTPTATEIGTAMHLFMEFADVENIKKNGIDNEIERLLNGDFITEDDKKKFNLEWLHLLPNSDLFSMMAEAKEIVREKKFTISVPYSELTDNEYRQTGYQGKDLFIQGSIDLIILAKTGDIVLVDYKTDHIQKGESEEDVKKQFEESHKTQLVCYSKAIESFYEKKPTKAYIYSFPLGKLIEIDLPNT